MKCPKCAAEAGSGRFCRGCGAPLAASVAPASAGGVCPSCGVEVRPGAKFCVNCAAPLGSAPVPPPIAATILICVNCGAEAQADTKFCKSCGKAIAPSSPAVSPDLKPTVMTASPVRPAAPPPQPPAPAAQPRPVAAAPGAPKLVAKSEPAGRFAGLEPPQPAGSNRILVITSIVVFALVAAGLVYKFGVKKPAAQSVQSTPAVEAPATAQPATSAPAEATPEPANPDSQASSTNDAQQPAATPPAGNSEVKGNGGGAAGAGRVPKRAPAKASGPAYAQAHANAERAFAASEYLNPPDGSALFWARKAKAQGDPGAAQIEQDVFAKLSADVTTARQSHSYDQALAQLYQLASSFPEHSELRSMQDEIHKEQQQYTQQMEEQRRQAEAAAQTKKFAVQHRHGTGESFCTGLITITPDGVGHYDCSTADSKGRCEHVTFGPDSLKEVKVKGDGSLHVATRQQGNFDFTGGDFAMRDASAALGRLVKH